MGQDWNEEADWIVVERVRDGAVIRAGIDQSLPLEIVEGMKAALLRMDGYWISGHDLGLRWEGASICVLV